MADHPDHRALLARPAPRGRSAPRDLGAHLVLQDPQDLRHALPGAEAGREGGPAGGLPAEDLPDVEEW
ncbi:hypothetical protein GCM10027521_28860 [Amycolatopsis cihanbeyliensis]